MPSYSSNCSILTATKFETKSTRKETKGTQLKNGHGKVRFRLYINVKKEKREGRLMAECNNKNKNCGRKKTD